MFFGKKGELKKLVPDEVEADYRRMFSAANQLANLFEQKRNPSMPKPAAAASKIVASLKEFKDSVPIIRALCNPGLQ